MNPGPPGLRALSVVQRDIWEYSLLGIPEPPLEELILAGQLPRGSPVIVSTNNRRETLLRLTAEGCRTVRRSPPGGAGRSPSSSNV